MERKNTLISRGLTDEKIISDLIEREKNLNLKTFGKLPSEMFDKVNYMCRHYMDRMAKIKIDYDSCPDIEALKKVLVCFFESAPVLHSAFIDNHISPYWKICDYTVDDILFIFDKNEKDMSVEKFFSQEIPLKSNVQLKIGVFLTDFGCTFCYLFNHMCMDGGGIKKAISDIVKNYNRYVSENLSPVDFSFGSRSYKLVYNDLNADDKKKAKKLFKNVSGENKYFLPLSKASVEDEKAFISRKITKPFLDRLKCTCKANGFTINEAVIAAYSAAACKILQLSDNERFDISCAVDLRRYINDVSKIGYANHMSYFPCKINACGDDIAGFLKEASKSCKEMKNDKFLGLHGLPLLNIGYSTMIYLQAEFIVKMFYNNSNLAVSNVGLIKADDISFSDARAREIIIYGAAKEKPCTILTVVTMNDIMNMSMCVRCNENDRQLLEHFFDLIIENLNTVSNLKNNCED